MNGIKLHDSGRGSLLNIVMRGVVSSAKRLHDSSDSTPPPRHHKAYNL
jgi:hypothetical protein